MNNQPGGAVLAARNEATDLVSFTIRLNGQVMNGEYQVLSLHVEHRYNKIASARLVLADGDAATQDFPISSRDDTLAPGSTLEIAVGYHARTRTVFKGIIISQALRASRTKHSTLTLEAKDKAIGLTIGRKSHLFASQSDADIINGLARAAGLAAEVEATSPAHPEMVQYYTTDWDFILSRAEMNGLLVLTRDNKLLVKKPDTQQEAVKEILYGVDVLEFESGLHARTQLKGVRSYAWNYKDQRVAESPEGTVSFKESGNLKGDGLADALGAREYRQLHPGNLGDAELTRWSNARLLKSRLAKATGRIVIKGTTEIGVGQVVALKGFGRRFNGNVLVTGVRQQYHQSVWETEVTFGLPEEWFYQREDVIEKPAAGLVPGVNGLQIGIVAQLEEDPDRQDRIKVRLPLVDAREGIWARVASLDAGNERGAFFRPEINDEVVVGFLNDDPRHAIVLGMLHSSGKPAPLPAQDDNHQKGFVTRSKIKFIFDDDKKSVRLETPKGKSLQISDEDDTITLADQHQNKITLSASGIVIESAKDIKLKTSSGNLGLEALNIEGKAQAKFSAEGTATASLQSSGPTVVKGAIVNIN
jgi:Rhs element Vgr protein